MKILNWFKKEVWEVEREEEAYMTVYRHGWPCSRYDCIVIHEKSNKGNIRHFMVELDGVFKGIKYPYDYKNKSPLVNVNDIGNYPKY